MKASVLLLLALVIFTVRGTAQDIPNNGFELWSAVPLNGNEFCNKWGGVPITTSVIKRSKDAHDGNYSMLMCAGGHTNMVSYYIDGDTIFSTLKPKYLNGYCKTSGFFDTDTIRVTILFGDSAGATYVVSNRLSANTTWTGFNVPISIPSGFNPYYLNIYIVAKYFSGTDSSWFDGLYFSDAPFGKQFSKITPNEEAEALEMQVTLYPNPSGGAITVEHAAGNKSYEICDVTGKTVTHGMFTGKRSEVDLSNVESGIYYLRTEKKTIKVIRQ